MRCLPLAILLAAVNLMFGCGQSASTKWGASACNGVDRALPNESKARMAGAIAAQLHAPAVEVLQSFRMGAWRIIYVDSPISDPPFLFFSGDPTSSRYVTLWSGAAAEDEAPAIYDWTLKNAPGIPQGLARCFAWHVTADRESLMNRIRASIRPGLGHEVGYRRSAAIRSERSMSMVSP